MFSISALRNERRKSPLRFRSGFDSRPTICLMFISPSSICRRKSLPPTIRPRLNYSPPPKSPKSET